MKKDIVIKVEGLSKRYSIGKREKYLTLRDRLVELPKTFLRKNSKKQDFWALKNVSFEVKRGEVLGIIGRNGAGKSTLLKILSRITEPTSGKITMKGRVASMLEVGTGFNPELTGRENIYLNGAILGMTKAEIKDKFDEIVEFSGVGKFLDTPVKRYSSGMYVRLAFAVAAHLDSDILIVDEVLAVGDAEFQKKCLGKMNSLAKSGKTVIFVSHNMQSISSLCHETLYLNKGTLSKKGRPHSIIANYHSDTRNMLRKQGRHRFPVENGIELKKLNIKYNKPNLTISGSLKVDNTINNSNIGFSIQSEQGHLMGLTYSAPRKHYQLKKGLNRFSLSIRNIYFTSGEYFIKIRIEVGGVAVYWPKNDISQFIIGHSQDRIGSRSEVYNNGLTLLDSEWK